MAKRVIKPYEEIVAANAAVRKVLDSGAEARLRQIPGVVHVSVGVKVQGRNVTNDLCIRVCVLAKQPETKLSAAERIPKFMEGVPTDVTALTKPLEFAGAKVRPLKGGTEITNRILGDTPQHVPEVEDGTFGFTAMRNSGGKPVLVTNCHVLMAKGGKKGDSIYQPSITEAEMMIIPASWLPYHSHHGDDEIAEIIDGKFDGTVDAGIAELKVSSCCRCCGLDFRDEIVGLSQGGQPPSNQILGRRPALPQVTVYKVGMRTDRTVGTVITDVSQELPPVTLNGDERKFNRQIQIAHEDTDLQFSDQGDSGSAIIDQGGYIVGLLFAYAWADDGVHYTFANHIADVMQAMDITPNFKGGGTTAGAQVDMRRATFPMPLSPSGAELYASTRARIEADPTGRWLWALAEEHREEIVNLVTTNRRVSVVWHRVGGPAIFANAINSLRAGDQESLPTPPTGTLEEAMARVGTALAMQGSAALRGALARNRGALLAAARGSRTLTEFLDNLRPHVHTERRGHLPEDAPA